MEPFHEGYTTEQPTTMPEDLARTLRTIIQAARETLEATGEVPPTVTVREHEELHIFCVRAYMESVETKERLSMVMQAATQKEGVQWLIFTAEVWVGAPRKTQSWKDVPLPSEDPRRTEAVSFMASCPRGEWHGLAPMRREPDRPPTFDKVYWSSTDQGEGRFAGFKWPKEVRKG